MNWLILTILSYLMLAIVNLGDKFIVDKLLKDGKAYAFIVGFLSSFVLIFSPWFLEWPGFFVFFISILSGIFFILALWSMFEALKRDDASRVVVVVGSVIPVFTIIFSIFFLKENFSINQWIGIFFLIIGMLIISFLISNKKKIPLFLKKIYSVLSLKYKKNWIFLAILSALCYSLFFIGSKYSYQNQEFFSAFIWIKIGGLFISLFFLLDEKSKKEILNNFKKKNKKNGPNKFFVFINQFLGAAASLIQSYAIYLGPVAIINALQGVQYAFLLILGIFFSIFFPKILKEDISKSVLIKKILAIILIAIGLYFISI